MRGRGGESSPSM
ncbi:hypothetical protein E2C01_097450 [Portunus trituberculatus]|uniref:Uncharacterized protein n=1 Tax=Portunus trituberculatus TaxID=210409 RepID=A0A5B7JV76_PORTR|nr:hypothetical protein [Portunus trituberculatus]